MFYFDFPIQTQSLLNQYWLLINYVLVLVLFALAYVSYKKTSVACGLLILLFPTYLFRAKIFGIPTTFLELAFLAIFMVWLIKNFKKLPVTGYWLPVTKLKYPIALLLLAGAISIFISPNTLSALGLWKAYFVEPILFFYLLNKTISTKEDKEIIFWCLATSTLPVALLAIFQKFTGFGIAEPMWVDLAQRRVTSIFTSPNAVGLYLGPITVMCFGWLIINLKSQISNLKNVFIIVLLIINLFAIIFTKSQGTWAGVAAGIIFLCYFLLHKKWTVISVAVVAIAICMIPQTQKILLPYITFSDQSGQNRIALWKGSIQYLVSSPKNFFLGSGLSGFSSVQEKFRDPKKIEPLIYPHNFFLNFWMETGLLGLLAMCWIIINFFRFSLKFYGLRPALPAGRLTAYGFLSTAAMVTILIHGLIDVPYFKNDLSMLFWTIIALGYL